MIALEPTSIIMRWLLMALAFFISTPSIYGVVIKRSRKLQLNQVFAAEREVIAPKISANGSFLAYTREKFLGLYVYDLQKKKEIRVSKHSAAGYGYSWAPGSFRIVYRTITRARSKSGRNRSYRRKYSINVFDLSTQKRTRIHESFQTTGLPIWSVDGRRIFFAVEENNENIFKSYRFVYDRNPKTGNRPSARFDYPTASGLLVSNNGGKKIIKIDPLQKRYRDIYVSPKRTHIVFETQRYKLYLSDISGKNVRFIAKGSHVTWHPKGMKFVFTRTNNPQNSAYADIAVYDLGLKTAHAVTKTSQALEVYPSWDTDGINILYALRNDNGVYMTLPH